MRPQYAHDVITSMVLWLDNQLGNTGQAYINITGLLYQQPLIAGQNILYTSPYRSWVYDSCVQGAMIPSGFYTSSGQFLTRASGIVIDSIHGRVSTPNNWGPTLSGVYARKEINVYYSSDEEVTYILEQVARANKDVSYTLTGLVKPGMSNNILTAPLIMLTNAHGKNKPWALGGVDDSKNTIRAFIVSDSNYLQDGVHSLLQDAAHQTIPYAPYSAAPWTISGDLKNPPWSYCSGIYNTYGCAGGLYIENVYTYKITEWANKNSTFFVSAMEIDLSKPRI
jgi:hypothetical protein